MTDPTFRPPHASKQTICPYTFVTANGYQYDIGAAIIYLARAHLKNGREDIMKARRTCEMILERMDRDDRVVAGEDPADVWRTIL